MNAPTMRLEDLKREFIEKRRCGRDSQEIDATAHMLLEMGNPKAMLRVALDFLSRKLGVCRIDAGLTSPNQPLYQPEVEWRNAASNAPSTRELRLPNAHPVMRRVWGSRTPVVYDDCERDPGLESLREGLAEFRTRSMMIQQLGYRDRRLGIVCVDQTTHAREWKPAEREFLYEFCGDVVGPLLHHNASQQSSEESRPSPAELEAVRLAADGLSYKQIARRLGKSVRTIEHQLRSARKKTDAANQTDLVLKCRAWL